MTEQIMTDRERTALQLSRARHALEKVWPTIEEEGRATETIETGWGNPRPFNAKSKFHYFAEDGIALCRKWGRFAGSPEVEEGNDSHPDNCAACKKKIAQYRAAKATGEKP